MKLSPTLMEFVAVAGFVLLGGALRIMHLDYEAVEHFDEGVYASSLWYDSQFSEPYPARHLYAPPLLSTMMECFWWVPGLRSQAPFLPSVLLGTATILGLWWLAKSWYGRSAGIFIAVIVAMSDFHILYSRMALTDVCCLFWIVGSVAIGSRAIACNSYRSAVAAGCVCGLAWWTKYTGWLPLAILCSGSGLWWMVTGRKSMAFVRITGLLGTIVACALVTFSPWWWQLQDVGGYAAVAETHASYVTGLSTWTASMARQLRDQFVLDGITGQLSLGIGLFLAGFIRWMSERSTWNAASGNAEATQLPPLKLLLRFTLAAIALAMISTRISTPLMLICIAIAGMSGIYLWPVLQRSWLGRQARDLAPKSSGPLTLSAGDLESAPTIDPSLGLCLTVAWFVGMLFSTPLYAPYSRLFFPLLAAIWLATSGGVSWWLESNLSVARRIAATGVLPPARSLGQQLVTTMLAAALVTSFFEFNENDELVFASFSRSSLFVDRRSIVHAATKLADDCVRDATGSEVVSLAGHVSELNLNSITPAQLLATGKRTSEATQEFTGSLEANTMTSDQRSATRMIVYTYGEPSLLYHLSHDGILAAPVSHLKLRGTGDTAPSVPTFLVFGPNAKRTPGFWEDLMQHSTNLRRISSVEYRPGAITMLDMFDTAWIQEHPEAKLQTLELYRVE